MYLKAWEFPVLVSGTDPRSGRLQQRGLCFEAAPGDFMRAWQPATPGAKMWLPKTNICFDSLITIFSLPVFLLWTRNKNTNLKSTKNAR
jgi:hypothetical protein